MASFWPFDIAPIPPNLLSASEVGRAVKGEREGVTVRDGGVAEVGISADDGHELRWLIEPDVAAQRGRTIAERRRGACKVAHNECVAQRDGAVDGARLDRAVSAEGGDGTPRVWVRFLCE